MVSKAVVFCTFALLVQIESFYLDYVQLLSQKKQKAISGQKYSASGSSSGCKSISISNSGGELLISAAGPIAPSGIAVATDLGLAGDLELSGAVPYLSAVEFKGQFDTSGSAPVAYSCGDCVAITQEIGNGNSGSSKNSGYAKLY